MARKKTKLFLVEYSDGISYIRKEVESTSNHDLLEHLRKTIPQYAPFTIKEIERSLK